MSNIGKIKWIWFWTVLGMCLAIWFTDNRITHSIWLNNREIEIFERRLTKNTEEVLAKEIKKMNRKIDNPTDDYHVEINKLRDKIMPACFIGRK